MKKITAKIFIILITTLYILVNFATFTNASVCVAEDHIGLNFWGVDSCCLERHQAELFHEDGDCIMEDSCLDENISADNDELLSNNHFSFDEMQADTVFSKILFDFSVIESGKNILNSFSKSRAPNDLILHKIKTVKLTI